MRSPRKRLRFHGDLLRALMVKLREGAAVFPSQRPLQVHRTHFDETWSAGVIGTRGRQRRAKAGDLPHLRYDLIPFDPHSGVGNAVDFLVALLREIHAAREERRQEQ